MNSDVPSLSTDQLVAFVELARLGSLRRAARELHVTEQGARGRLLALEQRLGVELYRKQRGLRRISPLTEHGRRFLPKAVAFLEQARELGALFSTTSAVREIHVAASQYLIVYLLIDAVRQFNAANPDVRVRLSTRTEQQIDATLLDDPSVTFGVAAPYEPSPLLEYTHLFSMHWSLLTPRRHRLLRIARLSLSNLTDQPLIIYEQGSTGRQHVMDAFHAAGLFPRIHMETTDTEVIVRMVEAGLGIALVPLLQSGAVTRGRRVAIRPLGHQIRPIMSGILTRRGDEMPEKARQLVGYIRAGIQ